MSQINNTFEYNGVSYEFDIRDAENSEKFENAVALMKVAEKNMPKTGRISAIYKASCEMIGEFFDTIFGEGEGVKICGERLHVTAHYDAYKAFMDFVGPQRENIVSYSGVFSQYSNRQQRRPQAHGKGHKKGKK